MPVTLVPVVRFKKKKKIVRKIISIAILQASPGMHYMHQTTTIWVALRLSVSGLIAALATVTRIMQNIVSTILLITFSAYLLSQNFFFNYRCNTGDI